MNIPVVYEDDWLLVADKPSGLIVIPAPGKDRRTLGSILNDDLKERGIAYRLHPCHRLDRETSGLIIYAKGKSLQKKMMDEFAAKKVKKLYLALVQGVLKSPQGRIDSPLDGRAALTQYRVIEQDKRFAMAEVIPLTGRKNQIRLHFKSIGHPLVGETRFALRRDFPLKAKRVFLHAKQLEFVHPVTKKIIRVNSQLPQDLLDFLQKNR